MTHRTKLGRWSDRSGRRTRLIGCVPLLVLGAVLVPSSPALAVTATCGQEITANTTLTAPVGPCIGNGLVVTRSDVVLDLGGNSVTGINGKAETSGIVLRNVSRVTVRRGVVTRFDAGVNIVGGSGNTVTNLIVRTNINDNVAPVDPANPLPEEECMLGDGITASDSSGNSIIANLVQDNGPYSGISLVGNSDSNLVRDNDVYDNARRNEDAAAGFQGNGNCGAPFARPVQDIGIRIEGPGATSNQVVGNDVRRSAINGISIHGYIYAPPGGEPPQESNENNSIRANYVSETGKTTYLTDPTADGIGVLRQGPASIVGVAQRNSIVNNTVENNFRDGIRIGQPTQPPPLAGQTITSNIVRNNRGSGIYLRYSCSATTGLCFGAVNNNVAYNRASGNAQFDGRDDNPGCDNNVWFQNNFGTVNQRCVHPSAVIPPPPPL